MEADRDGILFIVSAPSGAGKTTLVESLVQRLPSLHRSLSYTSRPLRPGETAGVDYNFISESAFRAMIGRGEFLEWAEVFGNLYGTSLSDTDRALARGDDLVLVIDVQGARTVRRKRPASVGVFVLPPSVEVLQQRLRQRHGIEEAVAARRLAVAREEVACIGEYDYLVVNDDLETALDELRGIVVAERARVQRMRERVRQVVDDFTGPD